MKFKIEKTKYGLLIKLYKPYVNLNKELDYVPYPIDGQFFTEEELLLLANFIYENVTEND